MKNNKKNTLILTLALVLVLGGAYAGYTWLSKNNAPDQLTQQQSSQSADGSGEKQELVKAPSFTVYDREGKKVQLSDFAGKPIILNFWASWCGPCKYEMPAFDEAFKKYGDQIEFVMVNATDGQRETVEIASDFIDKTGYSFPVYFDSDYDASMTYGVRGLPTTYFIDAEGYAVAMAKTTISPETLEKGIQMILPKE